MTPLESIEELRAAVHDWREAGETIAFVPTMGNLHRGHVSLVEYASELADRVVVSIFVNPTQFGEGEDFSEYPRTFELDILQLKRTKTDLVFAPEVSDVYPFGHGGATRMHVPELSDEFCGKHRPGHFDGVVMVVSRLFFMVQPDVAVFGQKDYQQLLVIRRMVKDLSIPIRIEGAPTVRDKDGLAMSSRNQYLNDAERKIAPQLYQSLLGVATDLETGRRDIDHLQESAVAKIQALGFAPEYVGIRDATTLATPSADCDEFVILAAARLGKARLIDNVVVNCSVKVVEADLN